MKLRIPSYFKLSIDLTEQDIWVHFRNDLCNYLVKNIFEIGYDRNNDGKQDLDFSWALNQFERINPSQFPVFIKKKFSSKGIWSILVKDYDLENYLLKTHNYQIERFYWETLGFDGLKGKRFTNITDVLHEVFFFYFKKKV